MALNLFVGPSSVDAVMLDVCVRRTRAMRMTMSLIVNVQFVEAGEYRGLRRSYEVFRRASYSSVRGFQCVYTAFTRAHTTGTDHAFSRLFSAGLRRLIE
jgi:hypothetical protein